MKLKYKCHSSYVQRIERSFERIEIQRGDIVEVLPKRKYQPPYTVLVRITDELTILRSIRELGPLSDSERDLTSYSLFFLSTKLE